MSFFEILFYVFLPVFSVVYLYLKKKYSVFEDNDIPHIKPSMIYGNVNGVGSKTHMADIMKTVYNACKKKDVIAGFFTLFSPSLIATDLELIKQILVKDFNSFIDRGVFVNEEKEPMSGTLFAIEGEKWRFLRNKLSPAFTSGKIKMMYNTISDKGEAFVKAIEKASKSGSVEMKDVSNRFTIDVISNCAFGMEANTQNHENEELVKVFAKTFGEGGKGAFHFFFLFAFPNFAKFMNFKQFDEELTCYINDVITESISNRETNNVHRNDFLNMLIQLKNKGSIDGEISTETRKLTMNEVIAQACRF